MGLFDFLRSSRRGHGHDEARNWERARSEGARRPSSDPRWDLHEAAYLGRVDVVRRLLAEGADANAHHAPHDTPWHCGPTPLSKAICAWAVTADHVAVVEMLLAHGAKVDDTHFADFAADATGSPEDGAILQLLRDHRGPRR